MDGIAGHDDVGGYYESLPSLWNAQEAARAEFYTANEHWWARGGYGGSAEEAMVGDDTSEEDVASSSRFLERLIAERLSGVSNHIVALDVGAGVGRVARAVLIPRCAVVHLLESASVWSARSRVYLRVANLRGSTSCIFTIGRVENFVPQPAVYHLVWCQWVLQYLTDADAVRALRSLASGLCAAGIIIVKENRPYRTQYDPRMFQMDTPKGAAGRYDILRPDSHHRLLFMQANLVVVGCEPDGETNFWILSRGHPELQVQPPCRLPTV